MAHSNKHGFTLVEVLVVVVIMGILSSVGVVSFFSLVAKTRVSDATHNTKAFLENLAQDAKRTNSALCLRVNSDTKLIAYKGECSSNDAVVFQEFSIESPNRFVTGNCPQNAGSNIKGANEGMEFMPRIGLSAAPYEGCIRIQYAQGDRHGAVIKLKSKNFFEAFVSHDDENWSGI